MIARLIDWSARNLLLVFFVGGFAAAAGVYALAHLPLDANYVLVQPEKEKEVEESVLWTPRRAHRVLALTDYRHRSIILLRID